MNTQQNQIPQDTEKLKEIPKLARRYAENRTGPLIIFQVVFLALFGVVFLSVYCFLKRQFILAGVLAAAYVAATIYVLITGDRHEARYFSKTGIPQNESVKTIRKYLPLPLIACVVISVIMEHLGVFSAHLRVPVSALYVCPMLIFANWRWARGDSFIGYLWAALYGAWAIAILFNVPLLTVSGAGQMKSGDEMYLAVPVTGAITGIVVYIYSRYALKKLKITARLEENNNEQ